VKSQEGPKRWRYDKNFTFWRRITNAEKKRNTCERRVKENVFILGRAPFSLACWQIFHFQQICAAHQRHPCKHKNDEAQNFTFQ